MSAVVTFLQNIGLGPAFFFPFIFTLVAVMAWFAYDEAGGLHAVADDSER